LVAPALLDDATVPRRRKKEGMVVKLVPILHGCAVDLGRHAAGVNQRLGIDCQSLAPIAYFAGGFS
jgi:hypothetical protein